MKCKLNLMTSLLFLLLAIIPVISPLAKKKSIDVYLIGGQSNATGQGYMANLPESFTIDTSVRIFYSNGLKGGGKPMEWSPLCQAAESPDRFGVELSMGTKLKELNPQKEIAIIKHALSGSNLFEQWNPGENKKDTVSFGEEFKKFVQTVDDGMQKLREAGYRPVIRGMVWQQGEADARFDSGMENSINYGQNLNHFIHRVRQQFRSKKMLFVYGYVIPVALPRFSGREAVRQSQSNVDQDSGHQLAVKGAFVVDTDHLPLRCDEPNSPYPEDKVHFNTFGILELGNIFAEKINQNEH